MESLKGFMQWMCLKENLKKSSLVKKNLQGMRMDWHQDEGFGKKTTSEWSSSILKKAVNM